MKFCITYLIILQRICSVSQGWSHAFTFFNIAILLASCQCPGTSPVFQDASKINIPVAESHSSALLIVVDYKFAGFLEA